MPRSPRTLRVSKKYIEEVKKALPRNGFELQKDLAANLAIGSDTVRKFFNGYPISSQYFLKICHRLNLEPSEIAEELNQSADIGRSPSDPWQYLRSHAVETDKIWSEELKRDLVAPLEEIRLGSRIRLAIELDRQGYLVVLDKGTSGKIYCLCPSSGFAPKPQSEPGVIFYLPQEGAKFPSLSVAGSEGQEEVLVIITDTPLDLEWLGVDSKICALELTLEHLEQLRIQLDQRRDWTAMKRDFLVI